MNSDKIIQIKKILYINFASYIPIPDHLVDMVYDLYVNKIENDIYTIIDNNIALLYYGFYFRAINPDYNKMKEYYLKAIDQGCIEAMHNIAIYFYQCESDYKMSTYYYLMAIERDFTPSMYWFGRYFYDIEKNMKQAIYYFKMAAAKCNCEAIYILSLIYINQPNEYEQAKYYSLMHLNLVKDKDPYPSCINILIRKNKNDIPLMIDVYPYLNIGNKIGFTSEIKSILL